MKKPLFLFIVIAMSMTISAEEPEDTITITVKQGDTLAKIARQYLEDAKKYPELLKYNKIDNVITQLSFQELIDYLKKITKESNQKEKGYKLFNQESNRGIQWSERTTTAFNNNQINAEFTIAAFICFIIKLKLVSFRFKNS